jgi:hypothetical protein
MAGKVSQGTVLSRETSLGSGSYTALANVVSWDGPTTENPQIDVTSLSSTAKEFVGGLVDFGELTLEVNFDPNNSTHQQIFADMEASPPTVTRWRITFVNPTINYTWQAFVKNFTISGAVDEKQSGSLTLRLSGSRTVS